MTKNLSSNYVVATPVLARSTRLQALPAPPHPGRSACPPATGPSCPGGTGLPLDGKLLSGTSPGRSGPTSEAWETTHSPRVSFPRPLVTRGNGQPALRYPPGGVLGSWGEVDAEKGSQSCHHLILAGPCSQKGGFYAQHSNIER